VFNKANIIPRPENIVRKEALRPLGSPPAPANSDNSLPNEVIRNDAPPATENSMGARLIVGPDVKLKGAEILDCDTLVVEGRVEATMDSRVIRISEAGRFTGKVSIDIAEIHGQFDGELTARSQLIIHATGKVTGKIRYGKLLINEGGELCGDINALSAEKVTQSGRSEVAAVATAISSTVCG